MDSHNTDTEKREMRINRKKSIVFTREMVKKVFNAPSGEKEVELLKRNDQCERRNIYHKNGRTPIAHTIMVLNDARNDDDETIKRSWVLLCLATVLCPGTGNMVPLECLKSLINMEKVADFGWDEYVLSVAMKEVKICQEKAKLHPKSSFWVGGCFPMLAVIYMDHLVFPPPAINEHRLSYSLPRACYVVQKDFELVLEYDRNKLCLDKATYGKRPLRPLSETPYAICVEQDIAGTNSPLNLSAEMGGHTNDMGTNAAGDDGVANDPDKGHTHEDDATNNPTRNGAPTGNDINEDEDLCGSLDEWLQNPVPYGAELELPEHLAAIYDKHTKLYSAEVKGALKSFGQVLQAIHCKQMGQLLADIHAASDSSQPSRGAQADVTFVVQADRSNDISNVNAVLPTRGNLDGAAIKGKRDKSYCSDQSGRQDSQSEAAKDAQQQSGSKQPPSRKSVPDDVPSCSLFPEGSEEFLWLNSDLGATSTAARNTDSASPEIKGPVFDTTPISMAVPLSTEASDATLLAQKLKYIVDVATSREPSPNLDGMQQPNPKHVKTKAKQNKRVDTPLSGGPKYKKLKIDSRMEAIYQQYIMKRYKMKKMKKGEVEPPFIRIGDFFITYNNFQKSLRPRAQMCNETMSLYIESFNIDNVSSPQHLKKFAFSVLMSLQLAVHPEVFDPSVCAKELRKACQNFQISKFDLLFFTIVRGGHWIVCVINLMSKGFNMFDSLMNGALDDAARNLLTNFKRLALEEPDFTVDLSTFKDEWPMIDYPQQETQYFGVLYMENFDGNKMKDFKKQSILELRNAIASKLFSHPLNMIRSADVLKEIIAQ